MCFCFHLAPIQVRVIDPSEGTPTMILKTKELDADLLNQYHTELKPFVADVFDVNQFKIETHFLVPNPDYKIKVQVPGPDGVLVEALQNLISDKNESMIELTRYVFAAEVGWPPTLGRSIRPSVITSAPPRF